MIQPGLYHILFISTALFFIGVYGFFTRRNLITMLMSVELVLNSVNLNFIAFNKYLWPNRLDGVFFTIFIIAIAAAKKPVYKLLVSIPIWRRWDLVIEYEEIFRYGGFRIAALHAIIVRPNNPPPSD